MQEPIRAGVVGFGLAGRIFHTAVIQATPGLELACVVERSGDAAKKEYPETHVARSVEEMLGDAGIKLVVSYGSSATLAMVSWLCLLPRS